MTITSRDGDIIGVPGYSGYLAFWVNQEIMDELGFDKIETKEDFIAYAKAATGNGRYGYGGSWEKPMFSMKSVHSLTCLAVIILTGQTLAIVRRFNLCMTWLTLEGDPY